MSTNTSDTEEHARDESSVDHNADDAGNAEYCAQALKSQFLHVPAYGWLTYADTHWETSQAPARLLRGIVNALRQREQMALASGYEAIRKAAKPNRSRINAVRELLEAYLTADVSEFDHDPNELNCLNGALNLQSGELTPHSPEQRFTYTTGVNYNPDADDRVWLDFLEEATDGNRELMDYLQLAVGYTLTGHTTEEIFFYIVGPSRSGKGTFTETLRYVLGGAPLASEVGFSTFTMKRGGDAGNFDLAPLKACRFVAAGESDRRDKLSSADIKRFTGGDSIRCSFKYGPVFEYRPQFKIWMSSNVEVRADPDDSALWARLRIISFPNSHAGREDKGLKQRLQQAEALEGVLKWAVEGATRWYALGSKGVTPPNSVALMTQRAQQDNDSVGQWIEERVQVTPNPECFTPNEHLFASYKDFCEHNGLRWPKTISGLTRSLKAKGYRAGHVQKVNGKTTRGCLGITVH